jgi:uncharacterized protein (TIGR02270 family)
MFEAVDNFAELVRWDVVEEHLDEAEFLVEQFESMLEHPSMSLSELANTLEARLFAHIDGLVVCGAPGVERLLAPQVAAPDPESGARVVAVVLALINLGRLDLVGSALAHESSDVRLAVARACALSHDAALEQWAQTRISKATNEHEIQALLELFAARGMDPPNLLEFLQSADGALVASAARAARHGEPGTYLTIMERLLEHVHVAAREPALINALTWGSKRAWNTCEKWALDANVLHPLSMTLYAALGGPTQHTRLDEQLTRGAALDSALFALGFSGNPAQVPVLLEHVRSAQVREAKLAAQAIATIIGIDLEQPDFVLPPEQPPADQGAAATSDRGQEEPLPPLEEDVEIDLSPIPEDALPSPNADAIAHFWHKAAARFATERRYLAGQLHSPAAVVSYLEHCPLRRRHALALAFSIASGDRPRLATRAFSTDQVRQLAVLRANPPRFVRYPLQ